MNERIKELIKQAQVNDLAIDTNGDLYDVKRLDPEKFAELIVEECAKRAEVYAYMSPNFNALAEELRKMIGVEE